MAPPSRNRDPRPLGILGLALLLALLGQASFADEPARIPDGLLLYAVAIALFTGAARWRRAGTAAPPRPARDVAGSDRRLARGLATALAVVATVVLLGGLRREHASYDWAWATWLFAIVATLAATGALRRHSLRRPSRRVLASVAGLVLLALLLRLWSLDRVPPTVSGDEASWALEALAVLDGAIRNPFTTGWLGHPTLGAFLGSLGLRLFGTDIPGSRMLWALIGALTIVPAYLVAARLRGPLVGLLTGLFLATWGFHIHFSRIGLPNIADGLLMATAVLCLQRALATGSPRCWAGAGLVTGLSLYSYPGARLTPVLVLLLLAVRWTRMSPAARRLHRPGALSLAGVAVVVAAPMLQFAVAHSNDFNARLREVGIFQSGWLEREAELLGRSQAMLVGEQVMRTALAFNRFPDPTSHYGSPEPLLGFVGGILFLLGLGFATLGWRNPRLLPMVLWWWLGVAGAALTVGTPNAARLTGLAVPSAFFAAVALERAARLLIGGKARPKAAEALALAICLVVGFASTDRYFRRYTPLLIYGNPHAVLATALGREARQWEAGTRLIFFGAPVMYAGFPTIPRLAPHLQRIDVHEPLVTPPARELACGDGHPAVFLFLPGRAAELELVRRTFPGGEVGPLPLPGSPTPAIAYRVANPCASAAIGANQP